MIPPPPFMMKKKNVMALAKYGFEVFTEVLMRDGMNCIYCGRRVRFAYNGHDQAGDILTFDHRVPKSRGGRSTVENLGVACRRCNNRKRNKTEEEFRNG